MKKIIALLLIAVSLTGLLSCEKEPQAGIENSGGAAGQSPSGGEFFVSNLSLNIPAEGGDCSFTFKTSESWTATLINGRADGWLTFTPTSGLAGGVTLNISSPANDSYDDRSATLRIVSGKKTTDLLVTQKQKDALLITSTKYEVPADGGDVTVEIKSNVNYTYSVEDADGWIEDNTPQTKALQTSSLSFSVSPNTKADRREGRIVFTDGSIKEVVSVYQKGLPVHDKTDLRIILTEKDVTLSEEGGTVKVEVSSDKNVSLRIPQGYDWIQEGNSESTNTFFLTVSGNESPESREGFVSFTDEESGFSENVIIFQMGKDAIAVAKSSYSFGLDEGVLSFRVKSNKPVAVSSDADWIHQDTDKTDGDLLVFVIAKAEAGTDRTGTITLRSGSAVQTITVRQYPQDDPIHFECQAVKDRLVELFDLNGDGELSYKEAADVTSLLNVFCEVRESIFNYTYYDINGNLLSRAYSNYGFLGYAVEPNAITSLDELQFFTGLTEIAPYAFFGMSYLRSITLPVGIKEIGNKAFGGYQIGQENGIRGLDSIVLPEGLESIGNYAFSYRPLSDGIILPSTLKTIGDYAFQGCFYISNKEPYVGLKDVVIPDSVEMIGQGAFSNCRALESVAIPSSIAYIGADAFSMCCNLKSVTGSAVSSDGLSVVGRDGTLMFLIGGKKNEYSVPEGVMSILNNSLSILYLSEGDIRSGVNRPYYAQDNGGYYSPLGEEELDDYLPKSLTIPSTFEKPVQNPFGRWASCLQSFKGKGTTSDGSGLVMDDCLVAVATAANPDFIIPSNVTEIGAFAFFGSSVSEIVIPDRISKIGIGAFENCQSLVTVTLPKGWKTIVSEMFYDCGNLSEIRGMDSVEEIGNAGLYDCVTLLKRFSVPASVKKLGRSSLYSSSVSIIELHPIFPPELSKAFRNNGSDGEPYEVSPFGGRYTVYVPDIAYERYQSRYYGWDQIQVQKLSELYTTPVFHVKEFDTSSSGTPLHVLRITEEGKEEDEYHYDFIKVESGSFERKVPNDPSTTLTVNITKDFYIATTEFPQWLWMDVTHCNPSNRSVQADGYSGHFPVQCVSWEDCNAFLAELGKLTGLNLRLPTEAEWEFAARGGKYSKGYAFSGSNTLAEVANDSNAIYPCGICRPNELGLYNMHGNVWEFCLDGYQYWSEASSVPCGDDPFVPVNGTSRYVCRGRPSEFSYYDPNTHSRIYDGFIGIEGRNRDYAYSQALYYYVGFRPAI